MFFCLNFSKYNEPCSEKSSVLCLVVMHSFMVLTGKMKTQSNMRCTCELEEPNIFSPFSHRDILFKMNLATEAKWAKLSCPQGPKVKKFAGEGGMFPFFFYSLSSSLSSFLFLSGRTLPPAKWPLSMVCHSANISCAEPKEANIMIASFARNRSAERVGMVCHKALQI